MRRHAVIAILSIALGLLLAVANLTRGPASIPVTNAATSYGYLGPSFFYSPFGLQNVVRTPTGEKPQSKLWFNDGRWWASMFNTATNKYHIFWLNTANQQWVATSAELDSRPQTKADCVWDGEKLYVVSGGGTESTGFDQDAHLFRYSYNATTKTYTRDLGPVTVRSGGAETIVLDKDSTGKIWITYTQNSKVYVNHSLAADDSWGDPYVLDKVNITNPNVAIDDISTLIAYNGKIGVLWSNHNDGGFYYAIHTDGASDATWTGGVIARSSSYADDHINLKSIQADPSGNLYAAIKTSLTGPSQARIVVVVGKKQTNGSYTWSLYTHSVVDDVQTRPLMLIDNEHRHMYVFTADESGGNIYYKRANLDSVQFGTGKGTLFMAGSLLNNVTSTKQTVGVASGIVVLASYDNQSNTGGINTDHYYHNTIDLSNVGPTVTPLPATPTRTPTATPPTTATPTPTATPLPSATPTTGPGNANNNRTYIPLALR